MNNQVHIFFIQIKAVIHILFIKKLKKTFNLRDNIFLRVPRAAADTSVLHPFDQRFVYIYIISYLSTQKQTSASIGNASTECKRLLCIIAMFSQHNSFPLARSNFCIPGFLSMNDYSIPPKNLSILRKF